MLACLYLTSLTLWQVVEVVPAVVDQMDEHVASPRLSCEILNHRQSGLPDIVLTRGNGNYFVSLRDGPYR